MAAEITGCLSQLSLLTTSTSHPYINRKIQVSLTVCSVPVGVLSKCMSVKNRPIHQCRRDGGWERKLSGSSNSGLACRETLCWTACALAGWLPACAQPGWVRASCAPRLASWSYPPDRIGYPNSDSQYSPVARLLSVVLPRPDSALSSSAGHDSESPYWLLPTGWMLLAVIQD